MPTLTIQLLGPVVMRVDGAPLAVDTRKATALLAYLAMTGRPASREGLGALLWPDSDDAAARGALRRTLSVLNTALAGVALSIDRSAVELRGELADVDVHRFRAALAGVRAHGHLSDDPCPSCLAALEEAVALGRGAFMEGFSLRDSETFDEWQRSETEAYRRDLAGALERLARGHAAAGAWERALDAARRWIGLDPLHEPAHRLLMLILARSGEPGAAIGQYRACVRILDAELGVGPLPETTDLYEEIRAGRVEPQAAAGREEPQPPHQVSGAPPLVGRERDLDHLRAAYEAIGPDGRLLVIEGEPGIGKSRLAASVAADARRLGGAVLEARAYAGEEAMAFAPITALVRAGTEVPGATDRLASVRPDLLDAVTRLVPLPAGKVGNRRLRQRGGRDIDLAADPFGRARLIEGLGEVLTVLAGGRAPGVLLIDDLDRADLSTVEVIAFLVRRLRGRPIAILVTWRPLEPGDEDRRRLLEAAEREAIVVRVVLGRLGRPEVADLVRAAMGERATDDLVDAVYAESEGLPLYVAEALAASPPVTGSIPGGALALLRSRIDSAGVLATQVLSAASVIGRSFDLEMVRVASGRGEEETISGLEELVRRGLIEEVGLSDGDIRFDFTHGRLRDVAYDAMSLARRRLLHRRVAAALRTAPTTDGAAVHWSRVAFHESQAGRSAEAAEAHRRAGEDALRVFANHEAREHLEAALALGHPATAELHETLGQVLTLLGDYAGAIGHLEAAGALSDPGREWSIERDLALVHARLGEWDRAGSHAAVALEAAPEDAGIRSRLLADRSAIAGRAGDPLGAETLARQALGLAAESADQTGVARACQVLGALARARGDLASAQALLERALDASTESSDPGLRVAVLNTLALVLAAGGARDRAIDLTVDALERCARLGDRHRQAALENNLADLLRAEGRRDEAMEHLMRAVALFAEVGGRPGIPEPEIWKLVDW